MRRQIDAWNIHYWCKLLALNTGNIPHYDELWKDHFNNNEKVDEALAKLISLAHDWCGDLHDANKYDAILVDEGQDFQLALWLLLRKALRENGEMLICADKSQNIYGVDTSWLDDPIEKRTGSNLSSHWFEFETSYRMPPQLSRLSAAFIEKFIPDGIQPKPAQLEIDLLHTSLKWVQCRKDTDTLIETCYRALIETLNLPGQITSVADLTLIVDNTEVGKAVEKKLYEEKKLRCITTFASDTRSERASRLCFFKGDGRAKITTIHCFKGWEAKNLVVLISNAENVKSLATAYTAITRLKECDTGGSLTVVNCSARLREYGKTWPVFTEVP